MSWTIIPIIVIGGLGYIFMAFLCGTHVYRYMEDWCSTSWHEHRPICVIAGVIWPLYMVCFLGWHLGRTHSLESR